MPALQPVTGCNGRDRPKRPPSFALRTISIMSNIGDKPRAHSSFAIRRQKSQQVVGKTRTSRLSAPPPLLQGKAKVTTWIPKEGKSRTLLCIDRNRRKEGTPALRCPPQAFKPRFARRSQGHTLEMSAGTETALLKVQVGRLLRRSQFRRVWIRSASSRGFGQSVSDYGIKSSNHSAAHPQCGRRNSKSIARSVACISPPLCQTDIR